MTSAAPPPTTVVGIPTSARLYPLHHAMLFGDCRAVTALLLSGAAGSGGGGAARRRAGRAVAATLSAVEGAGDDVSLLTSSAPPLFAFLRSRDGSALATPPPQSPSHSTLSDTNTFALPSPTSAMLHALINSVDAHGRTPLFCGIQNAQTDCVLLLIAHPLCDVTLKSGPWSPLLQAAKEGNAAVVKALLAVGRSSDAFCGGMEGLSAHSNIHPYDCRGNANAHLRPSYTHHHYHATDSGVGGSSCRSPCDLRETLFGWSALHWACRGGHVAVVELLVKGGVGPVPYYHARGDDDAADDGVQRHANPLPPPLRSSSVCSTGSGCVSSSASLQGESSNATSSRGLEGEEESDGRGVGLGLPLGRNGNGSDGCSVLLPSPSTPPIDAFELNLDGAVGESPPSSVPSSASTTGTTPTRTQVSVSASIGGGRGLTSVCECDDCFVIGRNGEEGLSVAPSPISSPSCSNEHSSDNDSTQQRNAGQGEGASSVAGQQSPPPPPPPPPPQAALAPSIRPASVEEVGATAAATSIIEFAAMGKRPETISFLASIEGYRRCGPALRSSPTALYHAIKSGSVSVVYSLMYWFGCDPNVLLPCGSTALHLAARYGHREMMELLLDGVGAGDEARHDAYLSGAWQPDGEVLLKRTTNTITSNGEDARRILGGGGLGGSGADDADGASLIALGLPVSIRRELSASSTLPTSGQQRAHSVTIAPSSSAAPTVPSREQQQQQQQQQQQPRPSSYPFCPDRIRVCDIEARNCTGATPLFTAVFEDYLDVARLLLSKGADPNAQNYKQIVVTTKATASNTAGHRGGGRGGGSVGDIMGRGGGGGEEVAAPSTSLMGRLVAGVGRGVSPPPSPPSVYGAAANTSAAAAAAAFPSPHSHSSSNRTRIGSSSSNGNAASAAASSFSSSSPQRRLMCVTPLMIAVEHHFPRMVSALLAAGATPCSALVTLADAVGGELGAGRWYWNSRVDMSTVAEIMGMDGNGNAEEDDINSDLILTQQHHSIASDASTSFTRSSHSDNGDATGGGGGQLSSLTLSLIANGLRRDIRRRRIANASTTVTAASLVSEDDDGDAADDGGGYGPRRHGSDCHHHHSGILRGGDDGERHGGSRTSSIAAPSSLMLTSEAFLQQMSMGQQLRNCGDNDGDDSGADPPNDTGNHRGERHHSLRGDAVARRIAAHLALERANKALRRRLALRARREELSIEEHRNPIRMALLVGGCQPPQQPSLLLPRAPATI